MFYRVGPTWKPGRNLTVRVVRKAQKGRRNTGKVRTVEEDRPSFFRFFSTPQFPEIGDEIDQNELEELTALVQEDFEIGCEIRDRICPSAILWYTGEATNDDEEDEDGYGIDTIGEDDEEDEDDDEEEDCNDEDEDEDEDDDEDDEDEEDEEDMDNNNNKCPSTSKSPITNPECKQQ